MKVEIKKRPEISINFGDLFEKTDGEGIYILHNSHEQIKLVCLSGNGTWTKYDSAVDAFRRIAETVRNGTLRHYPKDGFKLILEEI